MAKKQNEKPIIFFSHSSKDAKPLARLKERFVKKTHGAIEVFLSSDGQSIPLGVDWDKRIEEAMDKAKLMFTFVTRHSLQSSWIYFESGYAYAKKARVIPVDFLGFDLDRLSPPLSKLEGFNVTSAAGLNNIIAEVNSETGQEHPLAFSEADYQHICGSDRQGAAQMFGDYAEHVLGLIVSVGVAGAHSVLLNQVSALLGEQKIVHRLDGSIISAPGIHVSHTAQDLSLRLDPALADTVLPVAESVLQALDGLAKVGCRFLVRFDRSLGCVGEPHLIAGRLSRHRVTFGSERRCVWRDIPFRIQDGGQSLWVELDLPAWEFPTEHIRDLIHLLFDNQVLWSED